MGVASRPSIYSSFLSSGLLSPAHQGALPPDTEHSQSPVRRSYWGAGLDLSVGVSDLLVGRFLFSRRTASCQACPPHPPPPLPPQAPPQPPTCQLRT